MIRDIGEMRNHVRKQQETSNPLFFSISMGYG